MAFYAFYPPPGGSVLAPGAATAANQVLEINQLTGIHSDTTSIDSKTPTVGQKTMAASSPVVIASDQSPVAISNADLAALNLKGAAAFLTLPYDEMVISYVGATTDIDTVVTKLATVTQQTLTLGYDGSNRLNSVVVS